MPADGAAEAGEAIQQGRLRAPKQSDVMNAKGDLSSARPARHGAAGRGQMFSGLLALVRSKPRRVRRIILVALLSVVSRLVEDEV